MTTQLRLNLFGVPQFTYQDVPIAGFSTAKTRALLIYLAVTGRPHSRDALANLLWADKPATSRGNLKKVLSNLRKLEGITLVEEGWHLVALSLDHCWSDAAEFEKLAGSTAEADLQSAVQLYQDDFLAGFNTSLSYEFEEWALSEQARLRVQMVELLRQLADVQVQQDERPQAIATLRRLLRFEPWQEETHRQLIELLARNNDVAAALVHFEACREDLRRELDVDPSPATIALVAQIRDETFQAAQPILLASPQRPPQSLAQKSFAQKQTKTTIEFPLVGRESEWELIYKRWQTLDGAHLITIGGEAGIGKTRLAEELLLLAEKNGTSVARARSHELQGQLAYGPIADWLRSAPLQAALAQLNNVWLTEIARLQPEILADGVEPPQPLKEGWQRKRFFDALVHAFTTMAHGVDGPLLLVLDDLQWSDVDTLEWLQYLVESTTAQLLVVGTVRLNEIDHDHPLCRVRQQLQRQDKFTQLHLSSLTPEATAKLAAEVTGTTEAAEQTVADGLTKGLFQETAGNPLFVIESMRVKPEETASIEGTATDALFSPYPQLEREHNSLSMPTKMYSVIQSRLARLSPSAQKITQLGAAIGRAFDLTLLATAAESDENTVLLILDELWQQRIIKEVDAIHFDFNHDRIRDVAYAEIGPIKRRLLHRNVAEALEKINQDVLASVAGHIAVQYKSAGLFEKAIGYYHQAAQTARKIFAYREAANHHQSMLALLRQLPTSQKNQRREIDILLELSLDYDRGEGLGTPLTLECLTNAHEQVKNVGTPLQRVKVLVGLASHYRVCGEWIVAGHFANEANVAASHISDSALLTAVRFGIATIHMRQGKLEAAQVYFEKLHNNRSKKISQQFFGHMTRFAYCTWLIGHPEKALDLAAECLHLRRKYEPALLTIPLHHYSSILLFCGVLGKVDTLSAELVEIATKREDDFSLRWGLIYRGWILVQQGQLQEGITLIRENADEHRDRGNYFYECVWRSLLAEAYILASDFDAAFTEIDETLVYAEKSGDVHWNAQLLKLRGDCLQASGASEAEVERAYQLAIDTAHNQQSYSLELRATTSLCQLWKRQGKIEEAHQLLSPIYGWFTEGFDTADLIEAKTLLDTLESPITIGVTAANGEKVYA